MFGLNFVYIVSDTSAILRTSSGISRLIAKQDFNEVKAYSITQQLCQLSIIENSQKYIEFPLISSPFLVCCSCIYVQLGKMNKPLSGLTKSILQHALYSFISHPVTLLVAVFLSAEKYSNILLD